jgi:TonB family protein
MGDLPLPSSSGAGVLSFGVTPSAVEPEPAQPTQAFRDVALLDVLREAAMTGALSTDAILNALADAARILSGADGTAIASRKDGSIICRARSGGMAPDLGAPLNSDSGISGECLRTASIQICADALTDARVDSGACLALGIRSVAVVPLRGQTGIFGILEAFCARTDAFEKEQIDALRSLAEIAEAAYDRERSAAKPTPSIPVRVALFPTVTKADPDVRRDPSSTHGRSFNKVYWVIGCAVAVLAMGWIARMSWRQTGAEIAASAAAPQPADTSTAASTLKPIAIAKPDAAISTRQGDRSRKNATDADIETSPDASIAMLPERNPALSEVAARSAKHSGEETLESAPPVQVVVGSLRDEMPKLASETAPLPQFGGVISQGIVPAALVEHVNPQYPSQARSHGIGGDVILDATIAQNGLVSKVTVVSGPGILTNAAVAAVRQWRFSPALLDGKPVEFQKRVTIVFRLP